MQLFHGHEPKLKCPYKGCEKLFDKPTVITDTNTIPRQTHFACPYCMSKLNLITEKNKVIEVKPTEYPPSSTPQPNAPTTAAYYTCQEKAC